MNVVLKRNDVGYKFTYMLINEDNSPVNLLGTSVRFQMGDKSRILIDKPAVIEDGINGVVSYTFIDEDTLFSGNFIGEFLVIFSDEKELRYPRDSYIAVGILLNVDTEATNIALDDIAARQGEFSDKLNAIIANNSSLSEVIDARGTFITLNERLNDSDTKKANKTDMDTQLGLKANISDLTSKADKTQPNWIDVTFQNGWTGTLKYFKDTLGFIHLKGSLGTGTITNGTVIATLPSGYKPTNYIPIMVYMANQSPYVPTGMFVIDNVGRIFVSTEKTLTPNYSAASLDFQVSYMGES